MKFQSLIRFDWAMKTLLRDKANFDVLEGFLTALLNEPIKIEELLESESNPEDGSDKFNRVDLLVRDPEYYLINVERFQDVIAAPLDEWIYLFKHSEAPPNYQASGMAEAEQKLTVMRMTPEERRRYERYITNLVIEKDVIETSWEDGLAQGLSKGRSEGRLEERREIALRLQATGWTVEQIGEFFGQPIDDVLKWLNESP